MEFMALNLGSGDHATIPWTGDAGGALLIILVEIIGYTTARFAGTLFARITTTEPNLPGRRLIHNPIETGESMGRTNLQRAQNHEMERMNLVHRYSEIEYYAETIRNNALPPHLRSDRTSTSRPYATCATKRNANTPTRKPSNSTQPTPIITPSTKR